MEFVIVTGMSGAGKSATLKFLEDFGFFCVDNLPPTLINKFAEVCFQPNSGIEKVALGIDIRGGKLFEDFFMSLKAFETFDFDFKILFLDCKEDVLLKRYKETRRNHPLAKDISIVDAIQLEKKYLEKVKLRADYIIDTSQLLNRDLKEKLADLLIKKENFNNLIISVNSFGFKYGTPADCDLVFDVRFIPNPFYIDELKHSTGNDAPVSDYVMSFDVSKEFLVKLVDMIKFLIPNYISEGKNLLVIGIGCTGGKHRSVTIANKLFEELEEEGHSVLLKHIHIENDR